MKRLFFITLFLALAVTTAGAETVTYDGSLNLTSSDLLTRNTDTVLVAPYDSISNAAGNIGTGATASSEFLQASHHYRIRQSGTITDACLYIPANTNVTARYVKAWRKLGTTYYLVGTSNSLATSSTGTLCYHLSSPIIGAREGDFYSVRTESSSSSAGVMTAKTGGSYGGHYQLLNSTPTTTNYTWEAQTYASGTSIPVQLYMQAPDIVWIGDSILAGNGEHRGYADATVALNRQGQTIEHYFNQLTGHTVAFQNMGIGGETSTQIAARFTTDAVNLKPKYVVIEAGINDINGGVITLATYTGNVQTMITAAVNANIIPIVVSIPPHTLWTHTQLQTRDSWNATLKTTVLSNSTAIYVDLDPYLGQNHSGGDAGNLWDLCDACNIGDGSHLSLYGMSQFAKAVRDALVYARGTRVY